MRCLSLVLLAFVYCLLKNFFPRPELCIVMLEDTFFSFVEHLLHMLGPSGLMLHFRPSQVDHRPTLTGRLYTSSNWGSNNLIRWLFPPHHLP